MRMDSDELVGYARLAPLLQKKPLGAKISVYFHSSQPEGPAFEGPWRSCSLICENFPSEEEAQAFRDAVEKQVGKINPNSCRPYMIPLGNKWNMTIMLDLFDIARSSNEAPVAA